jgi:hypothetical protein
MNGWSDHPWKCSTRLVQRPRTAARSWTGTGSGSTSTAVAVTCGDVSVSLNTVMLLVARSSFTLSVRTSPSPTTNGDRKNTSDSSTTRLAWP